MGKNNGIDWSSLWKKDDWVAVWIGFLILIVFITGFKWKMPTWKWMTEGAFLVKVEESKEKVKKLVEEAEAKGESKVKDIAMALYTAIEAKDRKAIGEAAGKLEAASKEAKDSNVKKNAEKYGKELKEAAGQMLGKVFSGENLLRMLYLLIALWILGTIGIAIMGQPVSKFAGGFLFIYILGAISFIIGNNSTISYYGLEVVFWALILGLIVSNLFRVPEWVKAAVKTEYFIKIGLVLLGAEVLFKTLTKIGAYGMIQSILVIAVVFYFCYWVAKKLGLDDEFASILGTAVSICGVSAAIAAGGAVKGDPKKVSHTISLVLLCAIPMLILEPLIAKMVGMDPVVAGAWIGGTIDTTGAVVAAGAIAGEAAMAVAVVVKMAQNVLIGVAAFLLAIWFVFKGREIGERPKAIEIWYRFPKFVVGFIVASVIFSSMSEPVAKAIISQTGGFRLWWFTLAFICIGLETNFKELVSIGGGRPAAAFLLAQLFNILWTLLLAYLIFGGVFFPPPKF
ncbi:MAG: putative sulfate exporter family transporter [Deltaproteobacteria bacterium]|nr:putative sulfate exporter family transporter [Deltaproteobacteria bacterium]